jgi:hypothetical protein
MRKGYEKWHLVEYFYYSFIGSLGTWITVLAMSEIQSVLEMVG